ncbi:MAG: GNAT family N-acetyltransferase [Bdellovibrio sp.]|nr:GNAT family N-acetyltransferase [Methylotenera sp.]
MLNRFNQSIGDAVENWQGVARPQAITMHGQYCELAPLNIALHAQALFKANQADDGSMWTYLPYGPFDTFASYQHWLAECCMGKDPLFYVIIDKKTLQAVGLASYLRIDSVNGVIEVGHIAYSPHLQRTTMATEAMFLLMDYAFSLGYRRYEWKCNALNQLSCRAAKRLGFTFEGIFRHAAVVKSHNRNTAWYSIIDTEWALLKLAFQTWLASDNFDNHGQQRSKLDNIFVKKTSRH